MMIIFFFISAILFLNILIGKFLAPVPDMCPGTDYVIHVMTGTDIICSRSFFCGYSFDERRVQ